MKSKIYIVVLLFGLMGGAMFGQRTQPDNGQDNSEIEGYLKRSVKIPDTPEATAFKKYGNIDVDLYNGKPNISVPLYTFKGNEIDFPISLTYDASGIKVNQKATNIGLGWNLNIGGRITRTVNGLVDDYLDSSRGYHKVQGTELIEATNKTLIQLINEYKNNPTEFDSMESAEDYFHFLKDLSDNKIDTQPDYYSMNALSFSNHFVFDITERDYLPLDDNNTKISFQTNENQLITSWTVVLENGVKLFFEQAEKTYVEDSSVTETSITTQEYYSSWLLTKIISQNHKDVYDLFYTDLGYTSELIIPVSSITNVINDDSAEDNGSNTVSASGNLVYNDMQYRNSHLVLNQVNYNNRPIIKINYKSREDLSLDNAVDNIEVLAFNSNLVLKKYNFHHGYFGLNTSDNHLSKRLKLEYLEEVDTSDNILNDYSFDYSQGNLPPINSLSRDILGLYNGKNNTVLYSSYTAGSEFLQGANRNPVFSKAIRGTLNKITYPTGGYTLFEYGSNKIAGTIENIITYGSGGVVGGIGDGTNIGNCCLDRYGHPPKNATFTFNIETSDVYKIDYNAYGGGDHEAFIIKLARVLDYPITYEIDEITNDCMGVVDMDMVWNSNYDDRHTSKYFERGTYQMTLIKGFTNNSSDNYSNLKVTKKEESDANVNKAGIRIETIKNYGVTGNLLLDKRFKYTKAFDDNISSGKVLIKPLFNTVVSSVIQHEGWFGSMDILTRSSFSRSLGDYIVYPTVYEIDYINGKAVNGYIEYKFNMDTDMGINNYGLCNYYSNKNLNGKISDKSYFDSTNNLLKKEASEYVHTSFSSSGTIYPYSNLANKSKVIRIFKNTEEDFFRTEYLNLIFRGLGDSSSAQPPNICHQTTSTSKCILNVFSTLSTRRTYATGRNNNLSNRKETFINNDEILTTNTSFLYNERGLTKEKEITINNDNGDIVTTEYTYPFEKTDVVSIAMTNKNMISTPVETRQYRNTIPLSYQKTEYFKDSNHILPKRIKTAKGSDNDNDLEERVIYHRYDNKGNPLELSKANGAHICYIWGYDKTQPIAKIVGVPYSDIQNYVRAIQTASDNDISFRDQYLQTEEDFRTALNTLRTNLPNAQVTTMTYDPLIGLTSVTDPKGDVQYYYYDNFNRLQYVKDKDGNILSKNEYHYRD